MDSAARSSSAPSRRNICAGILIIGALLAMVAFQDARQREIERAETEFARRVSVRHALTREILGRYEDALFGLSTMFMLDGNVTRSEFQRATERLEQRDLGVQAFEWVPFVPVEKRLEFETSIQRSFSRRTFEITDVGPDNRRVRAGDRPGYYPICYVQPVKGNEVVLGFDLKTGLTREFLERARASRRSIMTSQIRLVQETADQLGVVLILPVYRPPRPAAAPGPDEFMGFVQGVFRVHDLFELICRRSPDSILDMLFVDASELDPAKRVLYYRPSDDRAARTTKPDEGDFFRGVGLEQPLPVAGRNWRVLYRPRAGWIEQQFTPLPWVRVGGVMTVTGLLAGLLFTLGRRTEHIQNEVAQRTAELNESRRQLDSMLHALPGMAFRCRYDSKLSVVYVSDGAAALTGRPAGDFLSGAAHFRDIIHPDDLERVRTATSVALDDRSDIEVEYRIRLPDGAEKWVLSRGRGVYNVAGEPFLLEGLVIDVTARKEAEAARLGLERKLLEGQKLESLGLLAGGIAHDFNNLLTGILGNASLARLSLPPGCQIDPQFQAIETASLRAAELCRQMLAYAGKGNLLVVPTDLSELAHGLVPLLEISLARRATLRLVLDRQIPAVIADPTQLRQIIMNLVINAADAIEVVSETGGEITVSTGVMHADATLLRAAVAGAELPAGDYVFVEVRDNGCGMPPHVLAKIFDPFFTTKFAGRGLGLAATLGIVRGHHGALTVESTPGQGSMFRLLLPSTSAIPVPPPVSDGKSGPWRHAADVLVIDDDEDVRKVTAKFLKTFGLTPATADGGHDGLALFRENPARYELVVLDLLMPGLSGEETLEVLRAIRPNVRVLLVSGYHEGDTLARYTDGIGPLAFLHKPFTREALEAKLRELLG